jgi:hypothetical protein
MTRMSCQPGNHRLARIQKRRSLSLRRGRNCRRRSTRSCCRRHKFSAANVALDLQQAEIANTHHGNIGPSGHLLAHRRLAVTFRHQNKTAHNFAPYKLVVFLPRQTCFTRVAGRGSIAHRSAHPQHMGIIAFNWRQAFQ